MVFQMWLCGYNHMSYCRYWFSICLTFTAILCQFQKVFWLISVFLTCTFHLAVGVIANVYMYVLYMIYIKYNYIYINIYNEDLCFSADDYSSNRVKEPSFKVKRQFNPLLFVDTFCMQRQKCYGECLCKGCTFPGRGET